MSGIQRLHGGWHLDRWSVTGWICSGRMSLLESRGIQLGNTGGLWLPCLLFDEALQFGDDLRTIIIFRFFLQELSDPFSHRPDTCFYNWASGASVWRRFFADITLRRRHSLVFGRFRLRGFFRKLGTGRTRVVSRPRLFRSYDNWSGLSGCNMCGSF